MWNSVIEDHQTWRLQKSGAFAITKSVSRIVLILNQIEIKNNSAFDRIKYYEMCQWEEKFCRVTFRAGSPTLFMTVQTPTGPPGSCSSKFLTPASPHSLFQTLAAVQPGSRQTPAYHDFPCASSLCHLEQWDSVGLLSILPTENPDVHLFPQKTF